MARRIGMGGLAALSAVVLTACGSIPLPLPSLPSLPIIGRPSAPSAPIADRRIDLSGSCSQTEEDGFREQATLTVADNNVSALQWQLWVGRRGSCRFDLSTFQQTKRRPSIEPERAQQQLQADGLAGPAPRHAGTRQLRSALHPRHL